MAYSWKGDKPLSTPMLAQVFYVYIHHTPSMDQYIEVRMKWQRMADPIQFKVAPRFGAKGPTDNIIVSWTLTTKPWYYFDIISHH